MDADGYIDRVYARTRPERFSYCICKPFRPLGSAAKGNLLCPMTCCTAECYGVTGWRSRYYAPVEDRCDEAISICSLHDVRLSCGRLKTQISGKVEST
jgi:hypothetical protein